ncbi:MAG: InlB B-repeat-containing protein, partial [Clostridia bacterium]|nr:InlB B-repeat-containing protein [Clostridia bacterium]
FVGWYPQDEALGTGSLTAFTMPAHNVILLGRFVAKSDIAYKVEHYTENLDGSWKLEDTEPFTGTTGETAYAVQKIYPGFTFDSAVPGTVEQWDIAGDGSLTLKHYYTRNSYEVTYEDVGTVPAAAAPAASGLNAYTASYKFGERVQVEADAAAAGYTFHGWYSSGGTVTEDMSEFDMPAQAVKMRGYFVAKSDTVYKVEHYFENIDDSDFTIDNAKTETFHALTDSSVTAKPLNVQGFTFDSTNADNVLSGVVAGDGSLVLKVYYKRNLYKVSYTYEGTIPATANPTAAVLATYEAQYKFGAPVTVKGAATAVNHTFHGWHYASEDTHTVVTAFDMPAHDVHLSGHFTRTTDPGYTVLHFFEKLDGTYDRANPDITQELKGAHGETVTAQRAYEEGFTLDETNPNTKKSGVVLDGQQLTLELYYTRNSYKVTYDYSGAIPADATPSRAGLASYSATYKHGETVIIEGASTASGYTFNGWFSTGGTVRAGDVSFVMPTRDVELRGYFVALSGPKYRIEHYFENIAGTDFVLDSTKTETLTGITGDKAQAKALDIPGFTFDSTNANNLLEGVIAGDGSLVLKVFYKRNLYKVSYTYEGTIPSTASPTAAVLDTYDAQYRFGAPVTVKGVASAVNHTFHGWHYANDDTHAVVTAFDMPAHDVHLSGHFTRTTDPGYTVLHF